MPHQFNNLSIEDDHINLILEAANWAPTHKKLSLGDIKY